MCVILLADTKHPTLDILNACHEDNSDGGSLAYFKNNKCYYKKDILPDEIHKLITELPFPYVIHFRASSGGAAGGGKDNKSPLLCHPFVISPESKLSLEGESNQLLIHNGTLDGFKILLAAAGLEEDENAPMSDTRALAMVLGTLKPEKQHNLLKRIIGKYILMDGATKTFKTYGFYTELDGIIYSNLDWQTIHYYNTNRNSHQNSYFHSKYKPEKVSDDGHWEEVCGVWLWKPTEKKIEPPKNDVIGITNATYELLSEDEKKSYRTHLRLQKYLEHKDKQKNAPMLPNNAPVNPPLPFIDKEEDVCCFCEDILDDARVNMLKILGKNPFLFRCLECEKTHPFYNKDLIVIPTEPTSREDMSYAG